jgi:Yip1 domain
MGNSSPIPRVYTVELMTQLAPTAAPADAAPKGLFPRILGVIFSPRATYSAVVAHPRWLGVVVCTTLIIAGGYFALLSTEVGKQALFDQQTQVIESFGIKLNDAAYERMQAGVEQAKITTPIVQLVVIPVVLFAVSGILLGIFNVLLGGDATYKQVLAVLAHSGVISAVQTVFAIPLDYVRETLSSPTTLKVFLPFVDDGTFLGRLSSTLDLFQIWGMISLAIGLGVLYKRRTAPIAVSLFIFYFVVLVAIAAVRTALSS